MIFCTEFRKESWHPGDRKRLLSHVMALPYAAKLALKDSRDTEKLRGILAEGDYLAVTKAKIFPEYCLHVTYGYVNRAVREHESFNASNTLKCSRRTGDYVL